MSFRAYCFFAASREPFGRNFFPREERQPVGATHASPPTSCALYVLIDKPRHLEHGNLFLPPENRSQLVVGPDGAFVLRVLEALPLDVIPYLARESGPGQGFATHHGR